ncbi:MAG TPA: radical SAM protein [Thermoanaerobaculia bacterium]|nr:radical SAM protein [Thermoanaerobaculia bacterium]
MDRVILVNPRMCSPRSARLPLSLLALGAVLDGRYDWRIVDGNVDPDAAGTLLRLLDEGPCALVGVTVMPGPQVAPAIEISSAVRARHPQVPIAWGGYFPTLYPDAAVNAPYVDYVVRGQGEDTLLELLEGKPPSDIHGLTWKDGSAIVHNPERHFRPPDEYPLFPYERIGDIQTYLRPSFLGKRTGVHQAAIGCRYRCTFCGVVSMFNGLTRLQGPARMEAALAALKGYGADSVQLYDHNFFDREETSIPILEVMARSGLRFWCYGRTDTLAGFSASTWELIRKSGLSMVYVGAEAASDEVLKRMKKGTSVEQTFELVRRCREHGVIPELSFVLGGPEDPEGEVEKTLQFIRKVKEVHPAAEVILYFYSPTPQRDPSSMRTDRLPVLKRYGPEGPDLPTTPEEWTQPKWLSYVCHQDAPWLSPKVRRRVQGFAKVLACRFPTAQDWSTPAWGKATLRTLAGWRYATGRWDNPWELDLARKVIPLREPQRESL